MLIEFGFFFEKKILYLLYKIYLNNCKMFRFDPAVDSEEYCSIITVQRYRIFTLKHYLALRLLTKCKNFEKKTSFFREIVAYFVFVFKKIHIVFASFRKIHFCEKAFKIRKKIFAKFRIFCLLGTLIVSYSYNSFSQTLHDVHFILYQITLSLL